MIKNRLLKIRHSASQPLVGRLFAIMLNGRKYNVLDIGLTSAEFSKWEIDAGKDWRQKEKGVAEDEMVR